MGIYWLLGGFVSLRMAKEAPRAKGLRTVIGVMGIVAGAALLARRLIASAMSMWLLLAVIGMLILLSGLLHLFVGVRLSEKIGRAGRSRMLCLASSKSVLASW